MLDTSICSYILKRHPLKVLEKFETLQEQQLCISIITYAELHYGVEKSSSKKLNQAVIEQFFKRLSVISWEREAALHYAKIRSYLEKQGTPIGNMDLLIAAHARSQNLILVTNNLREFERVPDLNLENWIESEVS